MILKLTRTRLALLEETQDLDRAVYHYHHVSRQIFMSRLRSFTFSFPCFAIPFCGVVDWDIATTGFFSISVTQYSQRIFESYLCN